MENVWPWKGYTIPFLRKSEASRTKLHTSKNKIKNIDWCRHLKLKLEKSYFSKTFELSNHLKNSSLDFRHTEEVVVGYGDSETESDDDGSDEDEDYELDSVTKFSFSRTF
jgi:hypothetical protein